MSNSLWPHGLQHPRLPCPSQFPRVCLDSCNAIFFSAALFFCLQSFPASGFFNQLALHIRWLKYWSFSFSISPSNEYSGLISFRINWFDLLAVQRTLKSLLQHRNSKVSVLWPSAFFMGPLSHVYMTTGKTPALTIWTSVGKVISLLFNMLFRFVIAFLSRSKCLLISWQQSLCEVFLESKKNLSLFPLFPHLFGTRCHELHFFQWWGCKESDITEQLSLTSLSLGPSIHRELSGSLPHVLLVSVQMSLIQWGPHWPLYLNSNTITIPITLCPPSSAFFSP